MSHDTQGFLVLRQAVSEVEAGRPAEAGRLLHAASNQWPPTVLRRVRALQEVIDMDIVAGQAVKSADFDSAVHLCVQVVERYDDLGIRGAVQIARRKLAYCHERIAEGALRSGQFAEATAQLATARDIYDEIGEADSRLLMEHDIAVCAVEEGRHQLLTGDTESARRCFTRADQIFSRIEDPHGMRLMARNHASCDALEAKRALDDGRVETARRLLGSALAQYEALATASALDEDELQVEADLKKNLILCDAVEGAAAVKRGDVALARERFRTAYDAYRKAGHRAESVAMEMNLKRLDI